VESTTLSKTGTTPPSESKRTKSPFKVTMSRKLNVNQGPSILNIDEVELFKEFDVPDVPTDWWYVPVHTENGEEQSTDSEGSPSSSTVPQKDEGGEFGTEAKGGDVFDKHDAPSHEKPVKSSNKRGLPSSSSNIDCSIKEEGDCAKSAATGFGNDVDCRKVKRVGSTKTKRFKTTQSDLSPCLLKVCQFPTALVNAVNIGDGTALDGIIRTFVQKDASITVANCMHPTMAVRQLGSEFFREMWMKMLDSNPDMVIDLKEIKLKNTVDGANGVRRCVVFKLDIDATRYGPGVSGLEYAVSGESDVPIERHLDDEEKLDVSPDISFKCPVREGTDRNFVDLLECSHRKPLSPSERKRVEELHAKALARGTGPNITPVPLLVNFVMQLHLYFDMATDTCELPFPVNGISDDVRHCVVSEIYQDTKIMNISESSFRM
jgi:hypothetical protein